MKYRSFLILTCTLFLNTLFAQEYGISKEQWNTIVDYTNAKVTSAYIDDLHKTSKPSEEDAIYFNNTLKPQLSNSSIESPISFDSISSLMKPHFKKTFNNFSFKINEIKNGPRELDSLFSSIETAFKDVKKEDLNNSMSIADLKGEIIDFTIATDVQEFPEVAPALVEQEESIPERGISILTLTNIIIFILFIILIYFIFLSISKHKMINSLEEDKKELEKDITWYKTKNKNISAYESQINKLKETISNQKQQIIDLEAVDNQGYIADPDEVRKGNTKIWKTPSSIPILTNFYSGKPTPNRTFDRTTNDIMEQETIFKFTYADQNKDIANFEVLIVSEFMKRQIINSPDDFLYRVCNNANSNQDFRKEIITERQGVAYLKDGIWVVDENDKALIRFQ